VKTPPTGHVGQVRDPVMEKHSSVFQVSKFMKYGKKLVDNIWEDSLQNAYLKKYECP